MILGGSSLGFSSLNDAFNIGTDTINSIVKTQQDLINKSSFKTIEEPSQSSLKTVENIPSIQYTTPANVQDDNDFDLLFLKLVKNPKFEDTLFKYISIFKPDLIKNICNFGMNGLNRNNNIKKSRYTNSHNKIPFNYMIFFVVSMFLYIFFNMLFKN